MTITIGGMSTTLRLTAAMTVDLVVLTVRDDELSVLLVRRGIAPFKESVYAHAD